MSGDGEQNQAASEHHSNQEFELELLSRMKKREAEIAALKNLLESLGKTVPIQKPPHPPSYGSQILGAVRKKLAKLGAYFNSLLLLITHKIHLLLNK